jgi:Fe2+ or Zn2+ uptake regulation protein
VSSDRDKLIQLLRANGLRVTAVRVAVLVALDAHPHATTDAIIRQVSIDLGSVSPQAVYNALGVFARVGVIRRIEPAGSVPLYELRVRDNHHHVVCRCCGAVQDVDCAVGERPCLTPSQAHGFVLDEAEVTYWGVCPDCQVSIDQLEVPG